MAIIVETKDCTQLGDAELAEMADLSAEGPAQYEIGVLSKQAEAWVLVSLAREGNKLRGFSFCTLERIGGTPCILIGCATIQRNSKRDTALKAIMTDQFRRAVLAFPDEDVVVGTRFVDAAGFEAYKSLQDIVPRPGHRDTGEERAWGRRLAKRFGIDSASYDDRSFVATGDNTYPLVLDHEALKPEKIDPAVAAQFGAIDPKRGDSLIAFGWAMAEELAKLGD